MNYSKPLVSVYITTHNRCNLLPRAVDSVLNQSYENIELIISNDGSSDETEDVILAYIKSSALSIVYVKNDIPLGANNARNKAINVASGLFITGLDDDDEFCLDRVDKFVTNWNDRYSFVSDNFFNESSGYRKRNFLKKNNSIYSLDDLIFRNEASNQIFTKLERLKSIGGFNEQLKKYQDWECWIRLANSYGKFKRFNWCSYIMHHDHELNRVSNNSNHRTAYEKIIQQNQVLYDNCSNVYIEKCLLQMKYYDININDILIANNLFEKKIMAKMFLKRLVKKCFRRV
ncbi:glycosyltransferase [Psychromonas sp. RZ22]|uniref:glycosyltransferase n=1 Tax=Psychromonas algarum TaxID=2555643 RepID=UPI0010682B79|nr:glycosyltransferase [Psychromonas sp. RZ22]TEW55751.1 glycosyltransferase [Psychromonas sp. RZ22]